MKRLNSNRKLNYDIVPKIKRKISYFYDYKNVVRDGRIVFGYRRIDMNKDFASFPFQDNSVCKLVGFTPDYVGQVHGGIMRRSVTNFQTLKKVINKPEYAELKKIYDSELCSYREVISPGYNTGISQFKNYFIEPTAKQDIMETVRICSLGNWKWFRIPQLEKVDRSVFLDEVKFNPDASPGHYSRKLISQKRSGSIKYTSQAAQDLYDVLDELPLKNYYLWEILGKQKDNKIIEGDEVSSRVIMNTEEPMVVLLSAFSQRLSKVIKNDIDNRIFIGKSQTGEIAKRLEQNRLQYDWTVQSDWIKFDSNITKEDMIVATSILLSNIDQKDGKMRRIVYLIMSSLITKYIAISPGVVMRVDKGLPSGHPFTSLVTSVINLVYWCRIGYEVYGKNYVDNMDIVVQGDDANVFMQENVKICKLDEIISKLGIQSDELKGTLFYNKISTNIFDTPVFLKRRHSLGSLMWDRKGVIRRIIYQWSKSGGHADDIVILKNYMITAPDDDLMNKLLFDMIEIKNRELGLTSYEHENDLQKFEKQLETRSKSNRNSRSLTEIFSYYSGKISKYESLKDLQRVDVRRLERQKYLIALFTAIPPDQLWRYKKKLNESVDKRDLLYLVEHITGGVPPNVILEQKDVSYYRFR